MKLRTLLLTACVLFVGLTSAAEARMNKQKRAGAGFGAVQSTVQNNVKNCDRDSSQTYINDSIQRQKRYLQICRTIFRG